MSTEDLKNIDGKNRSEPITPQKQYGFSLKVNLVKSNSCFLSKFANFSILSVLLVGWSCMGEK